MSLKENTYWTLDGILTTLWPRIKIYRNLGVPLRAARQAGHGYRNDKTRTELRNRWLMGMYNAQSYLTFKQKMRHYAFLVLGGLYQVREIIGIKART